MNEEDIEIDQIWTNGYRTIRILSVTDYNVTFDVVAGEDAENNYMSKTNLLISYALIS